MKWSPNIEPTERDLAFRSSHGGFLSAKRVAKRPFRHSNYPHHVNIAHPLFECYRIDKTTRLAGHIVICNSALSFSSPSSIRFVDRNLVFNISLRTNRPFIQSLTGYAMNYVTGRFFYEQLALNTSSALVVDTNEYRVHSVRRN